MAAPFRFDRTWEFPLAPDELWATLEHTERYPQWWSWLRECRVDGLRRGAEGRLLIRTPIPYTLRCRIRIDDVVPASFVDTRVSGDLDGPARLELAPSASGTAARLQWTLELRAPLLRPLLSVARPTLVWAHDRIVEAGVRQFETRALNGGVA